MGGDGPDWTPFDLSYPTVLLVALCLAIGLAVVVAASTSSASFGAYNAEWNGASELEAQATAVGSDADIVRNTTAYTESEPDETVALVLSPDRPYTPAETARIRRFVRDGGTLVVAEDYGDGGNRLLDAVGARARVDGRSVRDERYNYRSPELPVARNVSEHPLTEGVDRLTLNHGTVLNASNATVLVRTSEYAYLDANDNDAIDETESLESRPVAAVESVGEGRVVTVSDPSLFINAMLERSGNQQFTRNLFERGDRVLLDYSHTAGVPPLALALLVIREQALLQVALGLGGVAAVLAWSGGLIGGLAKRLRRDRPGDGVQATTDDLTAYLKRQYPHWEEERLERVVESVRRREE
ncbi:DUF4350 domain-containing protein [Halorarius halobius]|uniref:DUF4350 domain-containing protein n=1 Tax=Halorarius halobius TaxID=2962671 RepID=UPI0020CDDB4E|nr:DUF4350 domain-containing protein [Halorarius halobius]